LRNKDKKKMLMLLLVAACCVMYTCIVLVTRVLCDIASVMYGCVCAGVKTERIISDRPTEGLRNAKTNLVG
jgi:hypothetical protein